MRVVRSILQVAAFVLVLGVSGFATPITFVHTGSGSGSLAGIPFSRTTFTISGVGDTANRLTMGTSSGYSIELTSASINITGVGSLDFQTGTRFFVNNQFGVVGFSRSGPTGLDLFDSSPNPAFTTWDMFSSIGPINGTGTLSQWLTSPVVTNQGTLVFAAGGSASTFQATVGTAAVPEATSAILLSAGLCCLVIVLHSRKSPGSGDDMTLAQPASSDSLAQR